MAFQQFIVSDTNPNDNMGGGGCVCATRKQYDCKPPFVIIHGDNDMADVGSPYPVICASCAVAFARAVGGEVLSAGETGVTTTSAPPEPTPKRREPPVVESPDPRRDFRDEDTPDI